MAYDEPLASMEDVERFGLAGVTEANLNEASSRIRLYAGQQISSGISTISTSGNSIRLTQRPFKEILAVTDKTGREINYRKNGDIVVVSPSQSGFTITYRHGFNAIPDPIRRFVCTMAKRVSQIEGSAGQLGVVSEGSATETVSYSGDMRFAATGLTLAEQQIVDEKLFPRRARTTWQGV